MRLAIGDATTPLGHALVRAALAADDVELVLAIGRGPRPAGPADPRLAYRALDLAHARAAHDLLWGEARALGVEQLVLVLDDVRAVRATAIAAAGHPRLRRIVYRSHADVYALRDTTATLIDESAPLEFDVARPRVLRDRVEADLTMCTHATGDPEITVLRLAEVFGPGMGSPLWDYLQSRVCFRPAGFDPLVNLVSVEDAVRALLTAARAPRAGVYNIPGTDTLPLSLAIARSHRTDIAIPDALVALAYGLRHRVTRFSFRYSLHDPRFHFGGLLDGAKARREIGYEPHVPVAWPVPWWRTFTSPRRTARR